MENGYRKSLNIRFHLDPRTKLLLLILFSVIVMIDVTDGPAYIVRAIMTYIPVLLVCLEGKPHVGVRFTIFFILATWLMEITQENIGGMFLSEVLLSMEHPDEKAAKKILESLDLDEYKEKHPMALSGGQKQRVAIASAIAAQAQILLFDEPTSGLDYRHMREVAELLKRLAAERKTIFVSTHDPELIALCCDKIIRITEGRAQEVS